MRCYVYANLPFHCHYYCITMCSLHLSNIRRGTSIKRTQQQRKIQTVGNSNVFIEYFCINFQINYCFVLCMITFFLFSLIFNCNSSVEFKVISSLNITTQLTPTTKKTVGSAKNTYNCYQLPCYIASTMFFIFSYLYFGSPIVSIFYYCCLF